VTTCAVTTYESVMTYGLGASSNGCRRELRSAFLCTILFHVGDTDYYVGHSVLIGGHLKFVQTRVKKCVFVHQRCAHLLHLLHGLKRCSVVLLCVCVRERDVCACVWGGGGGVH